MQQSRVRVYTSSLSFISGVWGRATVSAYERANDASVLSARVLSQLVPVSKTGAWLRLFHGLFASLVSTCGLPMHRASV